jgi:hypothetical protein
MPIVAQGKGADTYIRHNKHIRTKRLFLWP